jgi:P27 family predicted phage terminase small subunit
MGGKGSGGHNRKSAAVRRAEGNAGKRSINEREPEAPPASAQAPKRLTAIEREFWDEIFPIVSQMQVMKESDVLALTQLCRFLAEERQLTEDIANTGRLVPRKNEAGEVIAVVANPLYRMRSDAARHVRAYLAVFGLGPAFRAALRVDPNDPPSDPLENVRRAKTSSDVVH